MARKKPGRKKGPTPKRGIAWPRWTGFHGMTVRDWLQMLIVPLALVVIGLLFDLRQQGIEEQRAERERELARQRAQDEALQAYLDQMSSLLLEKDLRTSEEDSEVRTLARARTLTVLGRLDPSRKAAVMQFLAEAELVQRVDQIRPTVDLSEADLSSADLSEVNLSGAQLPSANLSHADLPSADLSGANLDGADLSIASLPSADLSGANLYGAEGVTGEELEQQAKSLEEATMPNGQKYEEWLKSKGRG